MQLLEVSDAVRHVYIYIYMYIYIYIYVIRRLRIKTHDRQQPQVLGISNVTDRTGSCAVYVPYRQWFLLTEQKCVNIIFCFPISRHLKYLNPK